MLAIARQSRIWLSSLLLLAGCAPPTALDVIAPGDYAIYRVASGETHASSGCGSDIQREDDSSTFLQSSTFVLYVGPNDVYYLENAPVTLQGMRAGDELTFSGRTLDISYLGPSTSPKDTKITREQITTIAMKLEGAAVSGSFTAKTTEDCAGTCIGFVKESCTLSAEFAGTRVKDTDVDHPL